MKKPIRKQIIFITAGILIAALIIYGFLPGAEQVETVQAESATMRVTVEEEGETFVEQHYAVSSPTTGFLRRIKLDPGDLVSEGDPVAELESPRSALLDPRSQAEADARIEAAEAAFEQAALQAEQAIDERDRIERLAEEGSATRQQVEQTRNEAARAVAAQNVARAELAAARAAADPEDPDQYGSRVLRAPAAGHILAVHRKSEGYINAGEPLVDIGDTDSLEVRVEVLSQDAVRIAPGTRVLLDQWGGEVPLEAVVTRVEQQGSVVISALGVEERRVQVIARFESPQDEWRSLGSGYRVLAQFIIWEEDNVLQVPTSALFRTGEGWAVFAVEEDRAARRTVSVGHRTGLTAQILEGLSEGERVIVHPGSGIEDGVKVEWE